jgi:hypothetical protein
MTADEFQDFLLPPMTLRRFNELTGRLRACESSAVFECLFAVAVNPRRYGFDQWASRLLVLLDPPCPITLEEVLVAIEDGELDLSNKLIPFYLAGQFGKANVVRAASGSRIVAVSGIAYWLGFSLFELVESDACSLHDWRMGR